MVAVKPNGIWVVLGELLHSDIMCLIFWFKAIEIVKIVAKLDGVVDFVFVHDFVG